MTATRTPDEIRRSIERNRADLAAAIGKLKSEVAEIADWRTKLAAHQQQAMIAAAATGFVLGGGLAAVSGIILRRPRRKR